MARRDADDAGARFLLGLALALAKVLGLVERLRLSRLEARVTSTKTTLDQRFKSLEAVGLDATDGEGAS